MGLTGVAEVDLDPPGSAFDAAALVFVHPHLEAMPDLRHEATVYIVLMYQFDISGRQFAAARQTREPR